MIFTFINSAKDNCIEKLRNPFFGTFITILILQNWQLVYSLFTFDYNITQQNKIDIINHLITCDSGWLFPSYGGILCKGAISSIIALLISYIILSGTAYLSNFYDSIVHPWIIDKATKGKKIVIIEKYETLHKNFKQIKKDLDNEKEDNAKSLKNLETLRKENDDVIKNIENQNKSIISNLNTQISELKIQESNLEAQRNNLEIERNNILNSQKRYTEKINTFIESVILISNKKGYQDIFDSIDINTLYELSQMLSDEAFSKLPPHIQGLINSCNPYNPRWVKPE